MKKTLLAAIAALAVTGTAHAQSGGIKVELNKLEPVENACRAYFVTQNLTDNRLTTLKLDVVMFDKKGIVAERLAVQIAPIPPNKTRLKAFDIDKIECSDLGQFLMNGVLACKSTDGPVKHCASMISVSARGSVSFIG